jgi:predicted RNase H-like nuclease (RuvC/YqgF family)
LKIQQDKPVKPAKLDKAEIEKYEDQIQKIDKKCEGQKDHIKSLSAAYDRVKYQAEELQEQIDKNEQDKEQPTDLNNSFETLKAHYMKLIGILNALNV